MPEPVGRSQRYMPGLDGLRALAVFAVIAYHLQFGWAPGGLLGVGVFFTLSGYLITDLLLGDWNADRRLHLRVFWLRRARRLLPALFVMLAAVLAWVTLVDRAQLATMREAVAMASVYTSNWYLIAAHSSYFAQFAPPAPLDHLWSLAVEEQFYLVWPWLLWLGLLCLPRRWRSRVQWLALPTLALAAASTVLMLRLYHPGFDPTRVYEGTDTRAAGLLIGAALAMVWPSRRARRAGLPARVMLDAAGAAGLAVILVLIWRVGQYAPFLYRGGLPLLSAATAAVVAAIACQRSVLGAALGWRPLRWLGVRSYGIYLWHFPVIVLTSPANATLSLPRAGIQVAATVALAALSWRFVEEPVRHGALSRAWARVRAPEWHPRPAGVRGWATATGATVMLVLACAGLSGAVGAPRIASQAAGSHAVGSALPPPPSQPSAAPSASKPSPTASTTATPGAAGQLRTSCRRVVHIGDSTSEGMISPDYLPNPAQRMRARYADVGVVTSHMAISGARSVVETLPGRTNGYHVAHTLVNDGYHGCWVIALGTNDTADVVVGSNVSRMARIQRMMAAVHGMPVMWVNVKSLLSSGPYAESYMRLWDQALLEACARYPNMRIYDWASAVKTKWYISDGIHFTSAGYEARAKMIADALAEAFPAAGHSAGCVVH